MTSNEVNNRLAELGFPHLKIEQVGYFYRLRDERMASLGIPQLWIFQGQTLRHRVVGLALNGQVPIPSPRCTSEQLELAKQLFQPTAWAKYESWLAWNSVRMEWLAGRQLNKVCALDHAQKFS